jgi:membrane protein implicated in regulation of membrane protease activity
VFVSGAEWAAEIDGDAPSPGHSVVVTDASGATLKVRAD